MTPLQTFLSGAGGAALIAAVWGLIKWILERQAAKRNKGKMDTEKRIANLETYMQALLAGVRSLLYSEIKDRAKAALAAGEISAEELEDLTRKHELYHGPLKGNGYLDTLMDKLRALPVREQKGE